MLFIAFWSNYIFFGTIPLTNGCSINNLKPNFWLTVCQPFSSHFWLLVYFKCWVHFYFFNFFIIIKPIMHNSCNFILWIQNISTNPTNFWKQGYNVTCCGTSFFHHLVLTFTFCAYATNKLIVFTRTYLLYFLL
jgi:hypothetical protein